MSIIRLNKEFFEYFTINTNPTRTYTSASNLGITGSVNIFPRNSPSEKELIEPKEAIVKELEDNDFEVEILEEEDVVKEEDDDWLEES